MWNKDANGGQKEVLVKKLSRGKGKESIHFNGEFNAPKRWA